MIHIVRDEHSLSKDTALARHVVGIHMNEIENTMEMADGSNPDLIDPDFLRSYIAYARARCFPRLSQGALGLLSDYYVKMRSEVHEMELAMESRSTIPITVRQLEAIVRIAESLAKMELAPRATEVHVTEAIRLFRISTLNAVHAGHAVEGSLRPELMAEVEKVERYIKHRLTVGSSISYQSMLKELVTVKKFQEAAVLRAIDILVSQEILLWKSQRRVLVRTRG